MKNKWNYNSKDREAFVNECLNDVRISGTTSSQLKILYNRGIDTIEKVLKFKFSTLNDLHDPRLMKDAQEAVRIMIYHKNKGSVIVWMNDYDSDGAHSGSVGTLGMRGAGFKEVYPYANNRFTQGYGMQVSSVDEILTLYPDVKLIITADNGIMCHEAVDYAKAKGIDVIVTDHHEQGDTLPNADAVVDPKRKDDSYPFKGLCGAGVVYKLLTLLYYELGLKVSDTYDLLDMVAMATVGDIVPIQDENRILVKEGLKRIRNGDRYVFRAFQEVTGVTEINTHYTLGFVFIPMINAIGRLEGSVNDVFRMYLSEDEEEIKDIVKKLAKINEKRKEMTEVQCAEALLYLENKYGDNLPHSLFIANETFHEGVIGLIAGRIKERFNRPTVVMTKHDGKYKGSARSIPQFHIKNIFDELSEFTAGHGGHAMAAGLSVDEANIDKFQEGLLRLAEKNLTEKDFFKEYNIDDVFEVNDMKIELVDDINELEPYGEAFPTPLFGFKAIVRKPPFYMGKEDSHVKLSTTSDRVSVIMWREADDFKKEMDGNEFMIRALGHPSINVFRNQINVQFVVKNSEYIVNRSARPMI